MSPETLVFLKEQRRTIHIGGWSLWLLPPELVPLQPVHIVNGKPEGASSLGLGKEEATVQIGFQLAYYTESGDTAPRKAYVEKVSMELSATLLSVSGEEAQLVRETFSGGLISSGIVGQPGQYVYTPVPVALVSRNKNPFAPQRHLVVALYGGVCEAISLGVTRKGFSKWELNLKGMYGQSPDPETDWRPNGLGKIFAC